MSSQARASSRWPRSSVASSPRKATGSPMNSRGIRAWPASNSAAVTRMTGAEASSAITMAA